MNYVSLPKRIKRPGTLIKQGNRSRPVLVRGGREYFDRLKEMIDEAKDTIHLQTYIYDEDETGMEIAERLTSAAKRGVVVYLLVDGYASQSLSSSFIDYMRNSGINFRFFEPIFKSKYFYFGRRLHHKMCVIDATRAIVGGINISNRYNDWNGEPAWLDFALYVEGEIARELCVLCYKTWKGFPQKMGLTPCELTPRQADGDAGMSSFVRIRRNDWVRGKNQISSSYNRMLKNAKKEVTILCSYFLPGHVILNQLIKASRRGVKVKIIMAGQSDVRIAKEAERFIYKDLLKNNIEIHEYQKAILHGKIMICDRKCLTIGSYNVNNISAYASIELNLDVFDTVFASKVNDLLDHIARKDCVQITITELQKKQTLFERLIQWTAYQVIRLIFYLFTFYFRQHS